MPGNTIQINGSEKMKWYVGDSKLDELLLWLEENGIQEECKVITRYDKMTALDVWLDELIYPGNIEEFIQITKDVKKDDEHIKEMYFYTEEHKYRIYAVDRKKDEGYLGCSVVTRKTRPGENWVRGNDLPDGLFVKTTWDNILTRIISYELVKLSENVKTSKLTTQMREV